MTGLDPERTAGIMMARALWAPFWIITLYLSWRLRRWEREAFTAFVVVTTINMFFDIPFFFFAGSGGLSLALLPALIARSAIVVLAWSMVRNVGHLPLDRRFLTLSYLFSPSPPEGVKPLATPKR